MVEVIQVEIKNCTTLGIRVDLFKAPLLLIRARRGFLMCGYLNLEAAQTLGDTAAVVRGVNSFEEMLDAKVVGLTAGAEILGVKVGESGQRALERMC
jgi:uncharacterized protein YunC (DUF1805 family)